MVSFRRIDQLFQIVDIYRGIPHAAYDTQILLKDLKWQKRLIQGPQVKIQATSESNCYQVYVNTNDLNLDNLPGLLNRLRL